MAFEQLGGVEALTEWGRSKPGEFYALYAKLLPLEVKAELSGPDGAPLQLQGIDAPPPETREQWLERKRRELADGHNGHVVAPARSPV